MIIGLIFVLGAGGLYTYIQIDEKRANESASVMAAAVWEYVENTGRTPETPEEQEDGIEAMLIDGNEYYGILSIPSLSLELPVLSQWSYPKLKIAPCLYNADYEKNSLVVAAHNYQSHFGKLNQLSGGEAILLTDMDGVEHAYTVTTVEVTEPTDIAGMLDDTWNLTLFTCTYRGDARVTVRCMLTE